ncbi:hypothetical protein [[Actinomadura] parvosata]|uniref:hypothetical protein n=1 Tax=[Actinomadura] parvosata TaxID=1955412 RepID=UPI0012BC213E|nr:hypothetical protein [Nonomuraea sp. ATCC 55076]
MSRLTLAVVWVGALGAAVFPTWQLWRSVVNPGQLFWCGGVVFREYEPWRQFLEPLAEPLRADLNLLVRGSSLSAVPAIIVLAAFARRRSATAGRRAAAGLTLLAVLQVLSAPYFDFTVCQTVPIFGGQWFGEVVRHAYEGAPSLVAALLVLVATQVLGPGEEVAAVSGATVARRAPAVLIGYWTIVLAVSVGDDLSAGPLRYGLWDRFGEGVWLPVFVVAMGLYLWLRPRLPEKGWTGSSAGL